jgi:hypothetical protein
MNHETAIDLLGLKSYNFTIEELKKKYRKMALQKHPDKNGNTKESCEEFRLIYDAYLYLKQDFECSVNRNMDTDTDSDNSYDSNISYVSLIAKFLSGLQYNDVFIKVIQELLVSKFSWKLIERLDSDMLLNIYNFLSSYRLVFGITDEILANLKKAIVNKYKHVYILNPKLSDLLENKVYKLMVDDKLYMVPLWHKEIYFDCSNNEEIIVICEPLLPENINIDEENNILVELTISKNELFSTDKITFAYEGLSFEIPFNRLFIKREQIYKFFKSGITRITDDIYNVSEKSDIIVCVKIM